MSNDNGQHPSKVSCPISIDSSISLHFYITSTAYNLQKKNASQYNLLSNSWKKILSALKENSFYGEYVSLTSISQHDAIF